jgi:hypothetical protein
MKVGSVNAWTCVSCMCVQEEIYSSSYAAAAYLESIDFKKKVGCQSAVFSSTALSGAASKACESVFRHSMCSYAMPCGSCCMCPHQAG